MNHFIFTMLIIGLVMAGCDESHDTKPNVRVNGAAPAAYPSAALPAPNGIAVPGSTHVAIERSLRAMRSGDGLPRLVLVVREGIATSRQPGGPPDGPTMPFFSQLYVTGVSGQSEFEPDHFAVSSDGVVDVGWLPAAACREWPTRLALSPTDQMFVYESAEDASRAALGDSGSVPFARTMPGAMSGGQPMPIAETRVVQENGRTVHLAKVFFLGDLCNAAHRRVSEPPSAPTHAAEQVQTSSLEVTSQRLSQVDIAFVMDATGSMQQFIDATKRAVAALARTLAQSRAEVRFAIVGYRDAGSDSEWMTRTVMPFVSLDQFEHGLADLTAGGGGDEPEAGFPGIEAGLSLPWRADNLGQRILIVVSQTDFHSTGDGNPRGLTPDTLAKLAARRGVRIHALQVDGASAGSSKRLASQLDALVLPTGGRSFPVADAAGLADPIKESILQASSTADTRVAVLEGHARGESIEQIARVEGVAIAEATAAFEFLRQSNCIIAPTRSDASVAAATGWVIAAVDGSPRARTFVLARRAEITRLTTELFDLAAFADADTPSALLDWAQRPRKGSYFEPGAQSTAESLAAFLRNHSVYVSRGSILNLTSDQVRQMPERDREALCDRISKLFLPGLLAVRNSDLWTGPGGTAFVNESLFP